MNNEQNKVEEFMAVFGQTSPNKATKVDSATAKLRIDLILEELDEFIVASQKQDLVEVADALGDLLYVIYGAGTAYGIDLEPIFNEIHRSNMSKLWSEADINWNKEKFDRGELVVDKPYKDTKLSVVKRTDGKIIKSPSYSKANLGPLLGLS